MENASKALIIAGSILISVMVIAVGVYLYRSGITTTKTTTSQMSETVIAAFNAKFSIYETATSFTLNTTSYYTASTELNTISNVISAVNLAYSVNDENNYSYKYIDSYGLETTNAVEIIIDFGNKHSDLGLSYEYYLLEPNKNVTDGYVYGQSSLADTRSARISSFTANTSNRISCNELLKKFNTSKLVSKNNQNYTIYQYYFLGSYKADEITGQINSVKFTICYNTTAYNTIN